MQGVTTEEPDRVPWYVRSSVEGDAPPPHLSCGFAVSRRSPERSDLVARDVTTFMGEHRYRLVGDDVDTEPHQPDRLSRRLLFVRDDPASPPRR